jgi:hypothetical protein
MYRVSIKSFPNYKHLLQENYLEYKYAFLPLLKFVSKILCHVFIVTFVTLIFGCDISKLVDWERWSETLATTITGYHPPWLFYMGVCYIYNIWFLDATFPNRWSDTLVTTITGYNPLDFFYGGMLRTKCFRHQFQILQIWKARITDAFVTVTEHMLENTWREIDYWLDVLRATKGALVEVYWCVVKKNLLSYI